MSLSKLPEKHRCSLSSLYQQKHGDGAQGVEALVGSTLDYHEGKAIYISYPGLMELALRSQLPEARLRPRLPQVPSTTIGMIG